MMRICGILKLQAASALCFLFCASFGAEPDFYIWHRQQTPELEQAVTEFYRSSSGMLFFLAGELEDNGCMIRISPLKAVDFTRAVPVIRIHVKNLEKTPAVLADEIMKAYVPWKAANALQIDLDAPEFRLDYYRDVMLELRKKLPGIRLSATVLPCHLNHAVPFLALATACDYYVLQVHGLTRRNRTWSIYDHTAAVKAVRLAKKMKLPFKTALPLYCSRINGQWVKPDMTKVSKLAAVCGEVIGFRLGIFGDGSVLDLETSLRVCRGKGYTPKLETRWEQHPDGAWHLFIRNCGFFAERVTLSLDFKIPPADSDTFNHARMNGKHDELTLILPTSDREKNCLWMRSGSNEKPWMTIQLRGGNKL